jgi:hypothetical protein
MKSIFLSLSLLLCCSLLSAQELYFSKPQAEHEWLQQFVGTWTTKNESKGVPGQPDMQCEGTIEANMLGKFWVVSKIENDMMGEKMIGLQTIGYDPKAKKYIGTWVDSMFNHMWKYEGSVDKTGKILTLEAEGPNFFAEGKTAKFRDVYEFKSKDEIAVKSEMQGPDGKWVTFVTGMAKRTK